MFSVVISDDEIEKIKGSVPLLPQQKIIKYTEEYGLSHTDAEHLTKYRKISEFFDEVVNKGADPIVASKFITSQIFALFTTETEKEEFCLKITPSMLCELCTLLGEGKITRNLAKITLDKMLSTGKGVEEFVCAEDMKSLSGDELLKLCRKAVAENPSAVLDYKNGKEKAVMALLGAVMRESRGKADPEVSRVILVELMSKE